MPNPNEIANCLGWYDYTTGFTGAQWDDRSGLGNHLVQGTAGNRMTVGTRAYPNFPEATGSDRWWDMPAFSLNSRSLSVFALIRNRASELNTKVSTWGSLCAFPAAGTNFFRHEAINSNNYNELFTGIVSAFTNRSGHWTTPHVVGFTSSASAFTHYDEHRTTVRSAATNASWSGGRVGKYSGAIGLSGYISAFLIFDAALADSDALAMVDFLKGLGGRSSTATTRVLCCGDSIMTGETYFGGNIANIPERLGSVLPAAQIVDLAKSATTFQGGSGGGATQGPAADGAMHGSYTNLLVTEFGTNNISAGDSLVTLQGRLTTWLSDRNTIASSRSYTPVHIVCTLIDREDAGWTAGMETIRNDYNTWLRDPATQSTYGFTLCDPAVLAAFSSYSATYYQADKVHPNATGSQLYADTLVSTINGLLYPTKHINRLVQTHGSLFIYP